MHKVSKDKHKGGKPFKTDSPKLPTQLEGAKKQHGSKEAEFYEKYKDDLGGDYSLNDILEIGYPIIETEIDIITSGRPNNVLQELHIFLLEVVATGLNNKRDIAHFLGTDENDFILDELYTLLESGLLDICADETYRVTSKGNSFVVQQKFIPVTTQEGFTFCTDGFTNAISYQLVTSVSHSENRLKTNLKIDFQFLQDNWAAINKCYNKSTLGEKEIVDLANYKRSITFSATRFQKVFVLVYYPKDQSGKKIQIKAYSSESRYLKNETATLNSLFTSNKFLFDFSNELVQTEEFKQQFINVTKEIEQEKKLSGEYKDISTFEHKGLIKDALLTADLAVYIESPWIRRATMDYYDAIKFFLEKKGTKLFIAYGIDSRQANAPHKETFEEIEKLQAKYKDRFFIWHLPSHFQKYFPNRNGSHRKILIKDFDFYIKGSFNWLSYSGNETESYAVEEGTQFFNNVKSFWKKIFSDYNFDEKLIDF